ncbi:hypothetical protein [Vallitalea maricola]|uniref:Uncharacterized protein n=1 Tax=Vallitalea maricola TaxID=3074433 RepID=A0ACB5UHV5_9FIRM|nr:hypothetical protein AN2V17_13640 [Vallitalea sp. AN17-2]
MEKERELNFDEMMIMKEKRRTSRSKGKRTYEKTKIRNSRQKQRNVKNINYDLSYNEDYYNEFEEY